MPLRRPRFQTPQVSPPPRATEGNRTRAVPSRRSGARPSSWVAARGLSIACFVLYAAAQTGAVIAGWFEFAAEQRQHGRPLTVFGDDGFAWTALEQTLQNWQSEFLALAVLVALSSVLIHRQSKHSRDGNDEARQRIQAINTRVDWLIQERGREA
jgi:hypothetical protein